MKAAKETIRRYYKYQYQDFIQPVLISNGTLGGDSFAVAGNTDTYEAFNGLTSGDWAAAPANKTVIVYSPNPLCLTNVHLNAYSYLHCVYGLQEVLCSDTLDGEREVVFSQNIGEHAAERTYSFSNNTRYAKYWFITYASTGSGGYAIYEYQLTGTEQITVEATKDDYVFYKDIDIYKLPKINETYYGIGD